jgi:hypothetical protein
MYVCTIRRYSRGVEHKRRVGGIRVGGAGVVSVAAGVRSGRAF